MNRTTPYLALTGLVIALSLTSGATTIHVPGDSATIQAGINGASSGDTVLVADGTYTGYGNRDIDFSSRDIVLKSENGPEVTIIDCQGSELEPHRAFHFHSGEDTLSVIDGFTIMNGYIAGYASGGAILVAYATLGPVVKNCKFIGNYAGDYGGAIFTWHLLRLDNCDFIGNSARFAAGAVEAGQLNIRGCVFTGNYVETNGWSGGAVVASDDDNMHYISSCWFEQNSATYGGALFVYPNVSCRIDSSVFVENTATYGGALWFDTVCCDFDTHEVVNCTFVSNTGDFGSNICFAGYYYPVATVKNCIIAFGLNGESMTCFYPFMVPPEVICTDVFGNAGGDWVGCIADQADTNGNVSLDPMFCDTAAGDFRIAAESPGAPENNSCQVLIGALDAGCTCCEVRGDVDHLGDVNVADLTYLVDYLFKGGDAPPCQDEGDVDSSGAINVADLTYLVDYLFRGGDPSPPCP